MAEKMMLLMYISHFIGDYSIQPNFIAQKKMKSYYLTMIHCLLYAVPYYSLFLVMGLGLNGFCYETAIVLSHAGIDILKCFFSKRYQNEEKFIWKIIHNDKVLYMVDQTLHYICIFFITYGMKNMLIVQEALSSFPIETIKKILFIVIFIRPAYVGYKILLDDVKDIKRIGSIEELKIAVIFVLWACIFAYSFLFGSVVAIVFIIVVFIFWKKNFLEAVKFIIFIAICSCLIKYGLAIILNSI